VTATATAPAAPTVAGEDWLVWSSRGGNWTTRWVGGDAAKVVAERPALVVGEGARMWRVERHNEVLEVLGCDCALEEEAKCTDRTPGKSLGLRVVELGGGATTDLIKADTGPLYGFNVDAEQIIEVVGGTGSKLLVLASDEAYSCNETDVDRGVLAFDLAQGREIEGYRAGLLKQLPAPVLRDAAAQIKKELIDCEEERRLDEDPELIELEVKLVSGAPKLRWTLGVTASHACDTRHLALGRASSGLIPGAASLGLDAVPAGVAQALQAIGDADAVGWSRIEFTGAAREEALARFTAVEASVWPIERTARVRRGSDPGAGAGAGAEPSKLDEGRKHAREKNYAAAIAAFDAALAADKTLAAAYSGRGHARLLSGELDAAKADFEAALTHNDKPAFQASVYFNLGQLAEKQRDVPAARSAYTRSVALRPNRTVSAALAKLGP
jgi:tetratricopeptide (TPR) repeat protein